MRLVLCAVSVFIGGLLYAVPNMTRREILFAVPLPPDFRDRSEGREAISAFRTTIAVVVLACVGLLLFLPARLLGAIAAAMPLAIVLAAGISFYQQYRKLAPAAVQFKRLREAELTAQPERLPWFAWLAAGPFVILGAAAWYLHLSWSRIPARFPVHWGANGQPNRWAERTTRGVYGPLFFAAELCTWLLVMALAGWFGSRRSPWRSVVLGLLVTVQYLMGVVFALISVQALLGIPVWVIALLPIAVLIPVITITINKMSQPSGPPDPTPNECWKGAIFYYNPNDAVLFVEKRAGFGYTFNFANPWCWVLLGGLALVIASAPFIVA